MRVFVRKYHTLIKFNQIKYESEYFVIPMLQYIATSYYEPIYNY